MFGTSGAAATRGEKGVVGCGDLSATALANQGFFRIENATVDSGLWKITTHCAMFHPRYLPRYAAQIYRLIHLWRAASVGKMAMIHTVHAEKVHIRSHYNTTPSTRIR